MENPDSFSPSTLPLTWHDFLERMRHPSASEFVKAIKSFIVSFLNNPRDPQRDSASVQQFLTNMEASFRTHPLWAGRSDEELDSAGEGLEKYIMTKLYSRVFASYPDDINVDDQLYQKSVLVQQFIQPEHLDIPPMYQNETSFLLAQKELQKINTFKAPRDKLLCILSCCKVISNLLLNVSENRPGADEFLPVLIYVTIKANPPQLHSNLLYIQRYRRESRLAGEAAYFFTNMLSAEAFILNMDGKALSMDETEFEKNMESAQVLIFGLSGDHDGDKRSQSDQNQSISAHAEAEVESGNEQQVSSLDKIPSVSDLENKGASMLMKEEKVRHELRNFPYLYSQAGDLTVGDVEQLLNNYKQLVLKYVCLAKGMGVPVSSPEIQVSSDTRDAQSPGTGVNAETGDAHGPEGKTQVDAPEGKVESQAASAEVLSGADDHVES